MFVNLILVLHGGFCFGFGFGNLNATLLFFWENNQVDVLARCATNTVEAHFEEPSRMKL